MRKAIIRNGIVENTISLDDDWTGKEGEWQCPPGAKLVEATNHAPGDKCDDAGKVTECASVAQHALTKKIAEQQAKLAAVIGIDVGDLVICGAAPVQPSLET